MGLRLGALKRPKPANSEARRSSRTSSPSKHHDLPAIEPVVDSLPLYIAAAAPDLCQRGIVPSAISARKDGFGNEGGHDVVRHVDHVADPQICRDAAEHVRL